jgi:hypothetical protein
MTVVLKAVALSSSRAQQQHRVEAIERLDGGLLVNTEDRGVLAPHHFPEPHTVSERFDRA